MKTRETHFDRIRPTITYNQLNRIIAYLETEDGWRSTRDIRIGASLTAANAKLLLAKLAEKAIVEHGDGEFGSKNYNWWRLK